MPTGPITIQFSSAFSYIVFSVIVLGSCGILLKKGWETFFKKNKKIDDAVTKTEMEKYVKDLIEQTIKSLQSSCQGFRDNCTGKHWEESVAKLSANIEKLTTQVREDVKDIHKKVDTLILSMVNKEKGAGQ